MSDKTEYAIGLDLGGTSIKYGVSSSSGEILHEFHRPTQATKPVETILDDLISAAEEAIIFCKGKGISLVAAGMGTPGSVNVEKGLLVGSTPNFKLWKDVPIKASMEARLGIPVFADNDGNVMAFGEAKFGAGTGFRDVVCVTLGTGIGGGIIINNRIFRGSFYAGSEIGHMTIAYDGKPCRCGGVGCWEKYASASAMIEKYNELAPENNVVNSTIQIFEKYHAGDAVAIRAVENNIKMIAAGVSNIVNIFNPQAIIIGGGVSEAGEWFIDKIAEAAKLITMDAAMRNVRIVPAKLGNKAGWLGAAAFALHQKNNE